MYSILGTTFLISVIIQRVFYLWSWIRLTEFLWHAVISLSFESISRVIWPWAISVGNPRGEGCPTGNQLLRYRDLDSREPRWSDAGYISYVRILREIRLRRSFPSVWMEGVSLGDLVPSSRYIAASSCLLLRRLKAATIRPISRHVHASLPATARRLQNYACACMRLYIHT